MDSRFQRALDTGDLELRFNDGRSIKAHSQKLKLASLDGILHNLMDDVMEDRITGSKRNHIRDPLDDRTTNNLADFPHIKVGERVTDIMSGQIHPPHPGYILLCMNAPGRALLLNNDLHSMPACLHTWTDVKRA